MYFLNQGKVLNDKKTIEESNTEAGATIEMSLRIMGGMEKEELMETSETDEEKRKGSWLKWFRKHGEKVLHDRRDKFNYHGGHNDHQPAFFFFFDLQFR